MQPQKCRARECADGRRTGQVGSPVREEADAKGGRKIGIFNPVVETESPRSTEMKGIQEKLRPVFEEY